MAKITDKRKVTIAMMPKKSTCLKGKIFALFAKKIAIKPTIAGTRRIKYVFFNSLTIYKIVLKRKYPLDQILPLWGLSFYFRGLFRNLTGGEELNDTFHHDPDRDNDN